MTFCTVWKTHIDVFVNFCSSDTCTRSTHGHRSPLQMTERDKRHQQLKPKPTRLFERPTIVERVKRPFGVRRSPQGDQGNSHTETVLIVQDFGRGDVVLADGMGEEFLQDVTSNSGSVQVIIPPRKYGKARLLTLTSLSPTSSKGSPVIITLKGPARSSSPSTHSKPSPVRRDVMPGRVSAGAVAPAL